MANLQLSESEKTFILHGVADGFRTDGRTKDDYRIVEVETDVVTHANGSSHIRLAGTDVLVAVKCELDAPPTSNPNHGRLEFYVDCSATATPEFEGRGGEKLSQQLYQCLARSYRSPETLDMSSLCVIPGTHCWALFVDVLVLQCGGNLFDAVSLGVKAALADLRIPKITVTSIDGGQPEMEISDDPADSKRVDFEKAPVLITLTKIGNHCVVDPTPEEEACSMGSLVVGVTREGQVTSTCKLGPGSFHPKTLQSALQMASQVGVKMNRALLKKLQEEERMGSKRPRCGYLF